MGDTRAFAGWMGLLLFLASDTPAWAQAGPDGPHHATEGPGAGLASGPSPTGGLPASIPLELPAPRGHIPIPVSIVYTGSTRAGAAGAGWDVPISYVRYSATSWRRFPGGGTPGTDNAPGRVIVSTGGAPQLMVPNANGVFVPQAGSSYGELRRTQSGWTLRTLENIEYEFAPASSIEGPGLGWDDPDLWLLKRVRDAVGTDQAVLHYDASVLGTCRRELNLASVEYTFDASGVKPLYNVQLEYEPYAVPMPLGGASYCEPQPGTSVALFDRVDNDKLSFNRARVLRRVNVTARNNLDLTASPKSLRSYLLTYQLDPDTNKPRLKTVTVSGEEGIAGPTLPVATYTYGSLSHPDADGRAVVRLGPAVPVARGSWPGANFENELATSAVSTEQFDTMPFPTGGSSVFRVQGSREHVAARHLVRDLTGDGLPDLLLKVGGTWVMYKNRLTPSGPDIASQVTTWTEPAELHVTSTFRYTGTSLPHRWARQAMVTTETWTQFLDWNGDGLLDVVDAREGRAQNKWTVWLNQHAGGPVNWRAIEVDISAIHAYLETSGLEPILDHSDRLPGTTWPRRVPLERTRSWPRSESTSCQLWQCEWGAGNFNCSKVPCPQTGLVRSYDTMTEWQLADKNEDGFPDFVTLTAPVRQCEQDFDTGHHQCPSDPTTGPSGWYRCDTKHREFIASIAGTSPPYNHECSNTGTGTAGLAYFLNRHGAYTGAPGAPFAGPPVEQTSEYGGGLSRGLGMWTTATNASPEEFSADPAGLSWQPYALGDPFSSGTLGVIRQGDTHRPGGPTFWTNKDVHCATAPSTPYTTWQLGGEADLNADGLADQVYSHRRSEPGVPSEWFVRFNSGAGYGPPRQIMTSADMPFALSEASGSCDDGPARTIAGLTDMDGDGVPELMRVKGDTLYMARVLSASDGGTLSVGRITQVDNGYGASAYVKYANAKTESVGTWAAPFPEVVVAETGTRTADGSAGLAPTYFAYGRAKLTFDALSGRWTFPGYGRQVTLTGTPGKRGKVDGVVTVAYRAPSAAPHASYAAQVTANQIARTIRIEGSFLPANLSDYLHGASPPLPEHAETKVTPAALQLVDHLATSSPPLDCAGLDRASGRPVGSAMCGSAGIVYSQRTESWEGDAPPPSSRNIRAGAGVDEVDFYGRPTRMRNDGDLSRDDDDVCTLVAYAVPRDGGAFPSVPSSIVVTNCRKKEADGGANVLSAVRFRYDGLPEGEVIVGRLSHRISDRYDATGYLGSHVVDEVEYDQFGEISNVRVPRLLGTPATRETTIVRDLFGATVTAVTEKASDVGVAFERRSRSSSWPSLGVTEIDHAGIASVARFDSLGRLRLAYTDGPSGKIVTQRIQYEDDAAGRRMISDVFPGGTQVAEVDSATDRQRSYTVLDALGRARFTQHELGADYNHETMITGLGEIDELGRVVFMADPFSSPELPFVPDSTASLYGTTTVFDRRGRPVRVVEAQGRNDTADSTSIAAKTYVHRYSYSYADGQAVAHHLGPDESGGTVSSANYYDVTRRTALGRETSRERTDPNGTRVDLVEQRWDRLGRITETRRYAEPDSASGAISWRSHYDSLGRRLSFEEPGVSPQLSVYDELGNVLESSWLDGTSMRRTRSRYDGFGRLIMRELVTTREAAGDVVESTEDFHYDHHSGHPSQPPGDMRGHLSWTETWGIGRVFQSYDPYGRPSSVTYLYDRHGKPVRESASYSAAGRQTTLLLETGATTDKISYHHDTAGRMSKVVRAGVGVLFEAEHIRPDGRHTSDLLGNGVRERFSYSPGGRQELESWEVDGIGNAELRHEYLERDGAGRITRERHVVNSHWTSYGYTFDSLGRLEGSAQMGGGAWGVESYQHDPLGNRLAKFTTGGTNDVEYQPDALDPDRLCRLGSAGPCQFGYDGAGNVISDSSQGAGMERMLSYDAGNRLQKVTRGHKSSASFVYGPAGRAETFVAGSEGKRHIWHFGSLMEERTRPDGVTQLDRHIPGPRGVFVSLRTELDEFGRPASETTVYAHADDRANRMFTGPEGTYVQMVSYGSFGEVLGDFWTTPFQHSDKLWNGGDDLPEVGLVILGPRAYDPQLGRFLQRDPIAVTTRASTANPYTFSFSDPINYSDPSGMLPSLNIWRSLSGGSGGTLGAALAASVISFDLFGDLGDSPSPATAVGAAAMAVPSHYRDFMSQEISDCDWGCAAWGFAKGNVNRGLGVARAVGGTAMAHSGAAMMFVPGLQGVGATVFVLGVDQAAAGVRQAISNRSEQSGLNMTLAAVGGQTFADHGEAAVLGAVGGWQVAAVRGSALVPIPAGPRGFIAPKIVVDRHGQLTNGQYTIGRKAQDVHTSGATTGGKSQFLMRIDADKTTLDAAAYADHWGLWFRNRAKVELDHVIGVHGSSGQLTKVINVYRTETGMVHGAPGTPQP